VEHRSRCAKFLLAEMLQWLRGKKGFPMARWLPRKRTILGATLAAGLIVGIWLSDKLPHLGSGFGLGSGGDGILGKPDVSPVAVQASDGTNKSESNNNNSDEGNAKLQFSSADPPPDDGVLTILVDGRHYAVWRSSDKSNGYHSAELAEVVQLALNAKPNDDGLRVRIQRSESARVTAWQKLQTELVQAGVPAESIVLTKDLVK